MDTPRGAIVVGVDASSEGRRALDWAAAAAVRRKAPLHLVHAVFTGFTEFPPTPDEYRQLRDNAEHLLASAQTRAGWAGAIPMSTELVEQSAAAALIAASRRAGMVVVGSRGHGAVFGLLIGSVTQHVSQHAECPVVVVREPADPQQRRIVVGVDGSPGSNEAIGFAIETAAHDGAPLVALHGWRDHSVATTGTGSPAWSKTLDRIAAGNRLLDDALAQWASEYPEVEITREAIPLHPARMLADASEHAALVVVGSRGRGEFTGLLLGSVSQSMLHHARCPVAVVR
nr:universal stress protein [Pseudonocardia acidicola]